MLLSSSLSPSRSSLFCRSCSFRFFLLPFRVLFAIVVRPKVSPSSFIAEKLENLRVRLHLRLSPAKVIPQMYEWFPLVSHLLLTCPPPSYLDFDSRFPSSFPLLL